MSERGLKALENWAKQVTNGYDGVNVKDMSSSFRDGLAFCAIIHHYYPQFIDFESLSKENILHNNSLAFRVAEKELGVPALLDAEDMVKYSVPGRLSIITYLSQLHNCFENQNKVNRYKPASKRIHKDQDGPPVKVSLNEQKNFAGRSYELCQICKHRVYILERLIVSGKLYHRTCFRCHKCNTLLQPGAYVESDELGVYECAVCPHDEKETKPSEENVSNESNIKPSIVLQTIPNSNEISPAVSPAVSPKLYSSTFDTARNSFLQKNINADDIYEHDTSANSSLSELSSMSFEAGTEETQSSSLEGAENETSKKQDDNSANSSADSFYESSLERDLNSSRKPYQSVFSREISSLRPLAINRTDRSGFILNSKPGFQSQTSNDSKLNTHNIPLIKSSTYLSPLPLPRPRSVGNFQQKVEKESASQRRSSLDANSISTRRCSVEGIKSTTVSENENHSDCVLNAECEKQSVSQSLPIFESNSQEFSILNENTRFSVKDMVKMREENIQQTIFPEKVSVPIPKLRLSKLRTKSDVSDTADYTDKMKTGDHVGHCDNVESIESSYGKNSELSLEKSNLQNGITESKLESGDEFLEKSAVHEEPVDQSNSRSDDVNNTSEQNPFDDNDDTIANNENTEKQEFCDIKQVEEVPQKAETEKIKDNVEKDKKLSSKDKKEIYPDDLNPFGDDDEDESEQINKDESYPDTLNPFGDDDDDDKVSVVIKEIKDSDYDESKNPFADDEDEEFNVKPKLSISEKSPAKLPLPTVRTSIVNGSPNQTLIKASESPTSSIKGTLKKRAAPKPPHVRDIFQSDSQNTSPNTSIQGSPTSLKLKVSPIVRKTKRAPPPPSPINSNKTSPVKVDEKEMKNMYNSQIQSNKESDVISSKDVQNGSIETLNGGWKKKKRPAPPVPIPPRREIKKIPLKEIKSEMSEIEEKQMELEKQGRELEELIRDRDKDEEPTVEEEEYIMQLFELVNQKNALFRRQAELMYIKRSQRLEEQQVELEFQIRCLVSKPASQRTEDDEKREQNLIQQLLDVVDQRNDIIDSIEMDRKREVEEDVTIQEQMEIKNSDLPITAEIKEKSAQKKEKKKKDEKKKEKKERKKKMKEMKEVLKDDGKGTLRKDGDDGKGTLRKKWF